MKNRDQIIFALVVLLLATLANLSCQKEFSDNDLDQPHAARIFLTDHQTPVFDSVFIDIQALEVKLEDDSLSNGGWVTLNIRPGVYNILRFRNGIDTLFGTGVLPNARLRKLRMNLGTQNSAMKNGISFSLRLKDDDRQAEVDLPAGSFEINAGQVMFWIDFDAGRSIEVDNSGSGNNNGYLLRAHLRIFTQANTGRIEGVALPIAADPMVKAFIGTDTAMAIPSSDGRYRIVGLRPGAYTVLFDGHNNYRDTIINNVIVNSNQDTRLPTITLRQ